MPMSTDLPVRALDADTRKRINSTWNDVLKANTDSVVVAVAALIVVVLVLARVALPKSISVSPSFGSAYNQVIE
jgi:hypothetical protein